VCECVSVSVCDMMMCVYVCVQLVCHVQPCGSSGGGGGCWAVLGVVGAGGGGGGSMGSNSRIEFAILKTMANRLADSCATNVPARN
jgi:hypothetical protein